MTNTITPSRIITWIETGILDTQTIKQSITTKIPIKKRKNLIETRLVKSVSLAKVKTNATKKPNNVFLVLTSTLAKEYQTGKKGQNERTQFLVQKSPKTPQPFRLLIQVQPDTFRMKAEDERNEVAQAEVVKKKIHNKMNQTLKILQCVHKCEILKSYLYWKRPNLGGQIQGRSSMHTLHTMHTINLRKNRQNPRNSEGFHDCWMFCTPWNPIHTMIFLENYAPGQIRIFERDSARVASPTVPVKIRCTLVPSHITIPQRNSKRVKIKKLIVPDPRRTLRRAVKP